MLKRALPTLAALVVVAGCTPVDYGFGETTRWNIEQQVVDPDPQYAEEEIEGGSGERGAAAARRYRTGEVKQPEGDSSTRPTRSSGPR